MQSHSHKEKPKFLKQESSGENSKRSHPDSDRKPREAMTRVQGREDLGERRGAGEAEAEALQLPAERRKEASRRSPGEERDRSSDSQTRGTDAYRGGQVHREHYREISILEDTRRLSRSREQRETYLKHSKLQIKISPLFS